jgi:hypothetical protein
MLDGLIDGAFRSRRASAPDWQRVQAVDGYALGVALPPVIFWQVPAGT